MLPLSKQFSDSDYWHRDKYGFQGAIHTAVNVVGLTVTISMKMRYSPIMPRIGECSVTCYLTRAVLRISTLAWFITTILTLVVLVEAPISFAQNLIPEKYQEGSTDHETNKVEANST